MNLSVRLSLSVVFILSNSGSLPAQAQDSGALRVRSQVSKGPYYVGQEILVEVETVAESERPRIVPPKVTGADLHLADTSLKPITTSAIGDFVMEKISYRSKFRVVPKSAGLLIIPPFSAKWGERSGSSRLLRLSILDVPSIGRPPSYLGGVGPITLEAETLPASVRLGQSFEFRIAVKGPGSRGMSRSPVLERFDRVPLGLRVERKPVEAVAEPASRVFRYRIRPTRTGTATLPPVAISTFDPQTARFLTRVTSGLSVRVADVPRFDPSTLNYEPIVSRSSTRAAGFAAGIAAASTIVLLVVGWIVYRQFSSRRRDWATRRVLTHLTRRLDESASAEDVGRRITEGLAEYLHLRIRRPRGALTPEEACAGFSKAEGDEAIGGSAERLVAHCDRAQYSGYGRDARSLIAEAKAWLEELSRLQGRGRGSGGG
ncbi:hypothetical protein ACYOEI_16050 [Singulisphaera rosea]